MALQLIKATAQRFGVDRAVSYAVAARVWQLLSGQVTALLIIFALTKIEQGYYYAFMYLLAMQIFVELGLHVVLINVASHEWSQLQTVDGRVTGDSNAHSRLASLCRVASRWYTAAAIAFVVVVSTAGYVYFDSGGGTEDVADVAEGMSVDWAAPWLTLVVLTGMQLVILPRSSILEGCDQLPVVNRIRFYQSMAGSIVVWLIMSCGFGVWALCGSAVVRLLGEFYLVKKRYGAFFESLQQTESDESVDWKAEVVPLQWRIAVQGILHWFATHLAGLVLFKAHGEEVGGRFGLMWTVLAAIQGASLSWVETRRPLFGQLIAERNYPELDRQFFRLSRISFLLVTAGVSLFVLGVYTVNAFPNFVFTRIAARVPDLWSTAIFALAFAAYHPALCTNLYVRAHKRDPFLIPAVVSSLSIAVLVFVLGKEYGIRGSGIGYLIGVGAIQTPLWVTVWWVTRKTWHGEEVSS